MEVVCVCAHVCMEISGRAQNWCFHGASNLIYRGQFEMQKFCKISFYSLHVTTGNTKLFQFAGESKSSSPQIIHISVLFIVLCHPRDLQNLEPIRQFHFMAFHIGKVFMNCSLAWAHEHSLKWIEYFLDILMKNSKEKKSETLLGSGGRKCWWILMNMIKSSSA